MDYHLHRPSMPILASNLRALRRAHKLTQKEVAERAQIDAMHYHRIESEKWNDIRLSTVDKLAKVYGLNANVLLQPPLYRDITTEDEEIETPTTAGSATVSTATRPASTPEKSPRKRKKTQR